MPVTPNRHQTTAIFAFSMFPNPISPNFIGSPLFTRSPDKKRMSIVQNKPISLHYKRRHQLTVKYPETGTTEIAERHMAKKRPRQLDTYNMNVEYNLRDLRRIKAERLGFEPRRGF